MSETQERLDRIDALLGEPGDLLDVRRVNELVDRVEDRELGDAIGLALDRVLGRWLPPALQQVYPDDGVGRTLDGVR